MNFHNLLIKRKVDKVDETCENCSFCIIEGGDLVPFWGATTRTPEYLICNCGLFPEEIEDPCEYTKHGAECNFIERRVQDERN